MQLLYGTTNPGKLQHMRDMLEGLNLEILGLKEIGLNNIDVNESGNDPLENAIIKALAYFNISKMPVFSCDSGLYIDGLDSAEQPGVHVRRVKGKWLNDHEMIEYYSNLARRFGGEVTARYKNAICLVVDEKTIYQYEGEDITSKEFIIAAKPHPKRIDGFPLDSLSVEINSRKYYFDITRDDSSFEEVSSLALGFRRFFFRTILGTTDQISQPVK